MRPDGIGLIDCKKGPSLPKVTFTFGSKELSLSGNQLYFEDSGFCISVFMAEESGIVILGANFLKSFYTVFDYSKAQVSFASPTGHRALNSGALYAVSISLLLTLQAGILIIFG